MKPVYSKMIIAIAQAHFVLEPLVRTCILDFTQGISSTAKRTSQNFYHKFVEHSLFFSTALVQLEIPTYSYDMSRVKFHDINLCRANNFTWCIIHDRHYSFYSQSLVQRVSRNDLHHVCNHEILKWGRNSNFLNGHVPRWKCRMGKIGYTHFG